MTDRGLAENVHLDLDWKLSRNDRLIIKAFQKFEDNKQKLFTPDLWLMAGIETDYENTYNISKNRGQTLLTDVYAQLDYTHGP